MIAKKSYHQPPFLIGFVGGAIAMLLLLASSPISFQYYSHGHSQAKSLQVNSGTYQISISGFVPVLCRVSVDNNIKQMGENIINLGQMSEFCNDEHGYRIFVDHAASASGAAIIVDGRRVELSPQGSTLIYQSDAPARRSHQVTLDISNHPESIGGLWFRIQPI